MITIGLISIILGIIALVKKWFSPEVTAALVNVPVSKLRVFGYSAIMVGLCLVVFGFYLQSL